MYQSWEEFEKELMKEKKPEKPLPTPSSCKRPRNKRILKKAYEDIPLKINFNAFYFYTQTNTCAPFLFREYLDSFVETLNTASDADTFCNTIQCFFQNIRTFFHQMNESSDSWEKLFDYLKRPLEHLLEFTKAYEIPTREAPDIIEEYIDDASFDWGAAWKTLSRKEAAVLSDCSYLQELFPEYRRARKGHPVLRILAQAVGGFAGGYIGGRLGLDANLCIKTGAALSEASDALMDNFTSDSRQDKISIFEQGLNAMINNLYFFIQNLNEQLSTIERKIVNATLFLNNDILQWMQDKYFHKKDIKELLPYTHYLFVDRLKEDNLYSNFTDILQQMYSSKSISNAGRKRLEKIFYGRA